jgi:hypothetical protein
MAALCWILGTLACIAATNVAAAEGPALSRSVLSQLPCTAILPLRHTTTHALHVQIQSIAVAPTHTFRVEPPECLLSATTPYHVYPVSPAQYSRTATLLPGTTPPRWADVWVYEEGASVVHMEVDPSVPCTFSVAPTSHVWHTYQRVEVCLAQNRVYLLRRGCIATQHPLHCPHAQHHIARQITAYIDAPERHLRPERVTRLATAAARDAAMPDGTSSVVLTRDDAYAVDAFVVPTRYQSSASIALLLLVFGVPLYLSIPFHRLTLTPVVVAIEIAILCTMQYVALHIHVHTDIAERAIHWAGHMDAAYLVRILWYGWMTGVGPCLHMLCLVLLLPQAAEVNSPLQHRVLLGGHDPHLRRERRWLIIVSITVTVQTIFLTHPHEIGAFLPVGFLYLYVLQASIEHGVFIGLLLAAPELAQQNPRIHSWGIRVALSGLWLYSMTLVFVSAVLMFRDGLRPGLQSGLFVGRDTAGAVAIGAMAYVVLAAAARGCRAWQAMVWAARDADRASRRLALVTQTPDTKAHTVETAIPIAATELRTQRGSPQALTVPQFATSMLVTTFAVSQSGLFMATMKRNVYAFGCVAFLLQCVFSLVHRGLPALAAVGLSDVSRVVEQALSLFNALLMPIIVAVAWSLVPSNETGLSFPTLPLWALVVIAAVKVYQSARPPHMWGGVTASRLAAIDGVAPPVGTTTQTGSARELTQTFF